MYIVLFRFINKSRWKFINKVSEVFKIHDNPVIPEVTLDAQHKSEIIVINQINLNSVLILL
jgi:hypothetical protein